MQRTQKENHTPKLLNGGAEDQAKVRCYGAGQTAKDQMIAGFDVKQDVEEAQYNGTEGAINQQISTGGEDKIIGDQFQEQKKAGDGGSFL